MLDGYWLSPLRRGVFDPLYYWKNRSPLPSHWKELEKTQYLPEADLQERQWRSLQSLLQYVWEHNSFYRSRFEEAGVSPASLSSPDDLRSIPILSKEDIRRNTDSMISRGFDKSSLLHFKTGGSTGKSLEIVITKECSDLRNACTRRHDRWTGWEIGEPVAAVWGNPCHPVTTKEKLRNWLVTPFIYLDTMSVTEDSVRDFVSQWLRVKPTLLFGHAHSLYLLAQHLRDLKLEIEPKGILSTSMMLLSHERKLLEEIFGVKVTDRYGCEGVSLVGAECELHEGMHLNIDHLFVEFVREDGGYAAPGEAGRIVVTDLLNLAMPLIRYDLEDVGVASARKCACGRSLPLMEQVSGRVADFLIRRDGAMIAGISLIENTLTRIRGIEQMQIIQESLKAITLNVVPDRYFDKEGERELVAYFQSLFPGGIDVHVAYHQSIPSESNGKYRFSICKLHRTSLGEPSWR